MSKEWIKNSEKVIKGVEETLQQAYSDNEEYHSILNGDEPLEVKSLVPERDPYLIERTEALFWVDRNAYYEEMEFCLLKHHEEAIEFIKANDLKPAFHDLVRMIQKKKIVPFIGAGLSAPSDYPLWGDALKEILGNIDSVDQAAVTQKINGLEYFDAAQMLWDAEMGQVQYCIRNKFSDGRMKENGPHGAITLIEELSSGCIVTTNFDALIEKVVGRGNIDGYMHGKQAANKFSAKLIKGDRCLLKLHGDAEDNDTYVFTSEQYEEAYGNPLDFKKPLPKSLRQIYISSSMLFLGCSLEQDKTLELFSSIKDEADFDIPDHFAILPIPNGQETKNQKAARLSNLQIRPIWYPDGQHDFVEKYLQLALAMSSERLRDF